MNSFLKTGKNIETPISSSNLQFKQEDNSIKLICLPGDDPSEKLVELMKTLHVYSPELASYLTKVIASSQFGNNLDDLYGILAAINEIKPQNPLEILLVIQMFLTNRRAGIALKESCKCLLADDQERQIAIATKLMRLYTQQMEALRKFRNGGNQTINVNYINANQSVVSTGGI